MGFFFVLLQMAMKKRVYDWSHFLNEEDSDSDKQTEIIKNKNKKKQKVCPVSRGKQTVAHHMPKAKPLSLMDKSARSLAQYWTDNDIVAEQVREVSTSSISGLLHVQVGLFLHGLALYTMIKAANGLKSLAANCIPYLFQRFLVHVFTECASGGISKLLDVHLADYQNILMKDTPKLDYDVHRLGLSLMLKQDSLSDVTEAYIQDFYIIMCERHMVNRSTEAIYLPYPLPHVLRIDPAKTQDKVVLHFPFGGEALGAHQKWLTAVSKSDKQDELKGLACSDYTRLLAQEKSSIQGEKNANKRYIRCLNSVACSHYNEAHPLPIVLALLTLSEPLYMIQPALLDHETELFKRRKQFRMDTLTFLAKSLSAMYAYLDLPLACFYMAKQCLGDYAVLADEIRLAVLYQAILVSYGQWDTATTLFYEWFHRIPIRSKLFQELVVVHAKCVFSQIDDILIEIWITQQMHAKCSSYCHDKYIKKAANKILNLIKGLDRIVHQIHSYDLGGIFFAEVHIIQAVSRQYTILAGKCKDPSKNPHWDFDLIHCCADVSWYYSNTISSHLKPYAGHISSWVQSPGFWMNGIERVNTVFKKKVEHKSYLATSRCLADSLYSILACMIHCIVPDYECLLVMIQTSREYELYTANRHYRIPLLEKLINTMGWPDECILESHPKPDRPRRANSPPSINYHIGVPLSKTTAVGTSLESINRFLQSVRDAHDTSYPGKWSNDESFIRYLRQRDDMMDIWLDIGQRMMRLYRSL